MTSSLIPDAPLALRNLARELEDEATKYDKPRYGKERSTVADTLRLSASLARQRASRLEALVAAAQERGARRAKH